jgi:hypothetical protein
MTAIMQGSVIVNGNINSNAPSDSNQANNEYTTLQNSLSTGSSIAGMPVQSSDLTVNGGTIIQPTQGPNLALILGITIPIAVLCNDSII